MNYTYDDSVGTLYIKFINNSDLTFHYTNSNYFDEYGFILDIATNNKLKCIEVPIIDVFFPL